MYIYTYIPAEKNRFPQTRLVYTLILSQMCMYMYIYMPCLYIDSVPNVYVHVHIQQKKCSTLTHTPCLYINSVPILHVYIHIYTKRVFESHTHAFSMHRLCPKCTCTHTYTYNKNKKGFDSHTHPWSTHRLHISYLLQSRGNT